ncbi:T9SS type B sorting domain-containing protein [Chryseobacterium terrae]|uniref:Gliding motility-associated C-terminal domain-containing protein n=1 Tax=Chryseobacterium terrae TaxID=3163299 RepID=A0ABW8Y5T4_9FLAO
MKKSLLIFLMIISHIIYAQSDCPSAVSICGNSVISYTPTGPGNILEDLDTNGCLNDDENFSVWYTFKIATSGTLTFTITPNVFADDYDFAVYGPNQSCALVFGPPLRCNYSGADGPTGLNLIATNPNGGGGGSPNQFSSAMNVLAGQTYYLIIDNFSNSANGFSLNWGGTATLESPFNNPALVTNPFITPGTPNLNPAEPNEVIICSNPAIFDFSTLSSGIINGNSNFVISYYRNLADLSSGASPITTPISVNTTNTYYYSIMYNDPTNPSNPVNKCKEIGRFKFREGTVVANDATLTECNNNNAGTAVFNLTTANVTTPPNVKKYYPSLTDLNNGTGEITNPFQYVSAAGSVFVLVTSQFGCTDIAEIRLNFFPEIIVTEANLRGCSIESNPSTALFDLTTATVSTQMNITKNYYPSMTDAENQTNEILTPDSYIAPYGFVYVRVSDANGCYKIGKINLFIIHPVYSTVLTDKIICAEDKTTLDAGPGFDGYLWSTGDVTQTISDVGLGTYWVKLRTNDCIVTQPVKVYASEQPVISNIEIVNNTITVHVIGGMPPYEYSLDSNTGWQNSNVFSNLIRGDYTIFVRDSYNCVPIPVDVVVPNITNVITPNGDGINDAIDYSALSGKQNLVFSIFDRYGTKIFQADKTNRYKWDGTLFTGDKSKIPLLNSRDGYY